MHKNGFSYSVMRDKSITHPWSITSLSVTNFHRKGYWKRYRKRHRKRHRKRLQTTLQTTLLIVCQKSLQIAIISPHGKANL